MICQKAKETMKQVERKTSLHCGSGKYNASLGFYFTPGGIRVQGCTPFLAWAEQNLVDAVPSFVLTTNLIGMPSTPKHLCARFPGSKSGLEEPRTVPGHKTLPQPCLCKAKTKLSLHGCQSGVSVPGRGYNLRLFLILGILLLGAQGLKPCQEETQSSPVTQRSPLEMSQEGEKAMYKGPLLHWTETQFHQDHHHHHFIHERMEARKGQALPKAAHWLGTEAEPCALSFCPSP